MKAGHPFVVVIFYIILEFTDIFQNVWFVYKKFDESLLRRCLAGASPERTTMKVDDRKQMFATDLVKAMGDQRKFLEEIGVFVFSYDINDYGNDIKRKIGRHCRMVTVNVQQRRMEKTTW